MPQEGSAPERPLETVDAVGGERCQGHAGSGREPANCVEPAHELEAANLARRQAALLKIEELLRRGSRIGSWDQEQGSTCIHRRPLSSR